MGFLQIYGIAAAAIFGCMVVLWLVSLALRNSSIVDVFWGTGFVIANWIYFALTPGGLPARKLLVGILVTMWGLRLSLYVLWRNWGKPEDFRCAKWRGEEGASWWWKSLPRVFVLQGVLLIVISIPLLAAQSGNVPFGVLDYVAVPVWLIGFFFEAVGDLQLARFKANPANKGKVMNRGVWRYTRHPNYFGDAAQWWGYYLAALATGGWWTIYAPIIMTFLLMRVSGVALLEQTMETRPGYKEYVETTSAFVPWFPRKRA
jgi:steroid 5-alpha reductase family enzyme